jgi:hypothetical protein
MPSWAKQLIHAARLRQIGRRVVFTKCDELVFALAIKDSFPSAVFLDGHRMKTPDDIHADWIEIGSGSIFIVAPEGDAWRPMFGSNAEYLSWTEIENLPSRSVQFFSSTWDWGMKGWQPRAHQLAFEVPTLMEGDIGRKYDPDAPDTAVFLTFTRQLFRIVSRIGTNRFKAGSTRSNEVEHGTDELRMRDAKRRNLWLGHHALEWCRQSPRRMLDGAYRPCDDWGPPHNEWYRSLRRRVEEEYGPDVGEPTPCPPEDPGPSAAYLRARIA